MSQGSNDHKPSTAGPDTPVPAQPIALVTPSPTLYGELAASLSASLDQFTANVPGFDDETVQPEFVRRKQRIPAVFVERAVGALFGDNELLGVKSLNPDVAMDDKQYVDAMGPVEQKLGAVWKRLRFTVQVRKARLTRTAQQIYGIAKELARDRKETTLNRQVEAMASARPQTKKKARPAETPAPAPGKEGGEPAATAAAQKPMKY